MFTRKWGGQFLYLCFITTRSKQDWRHSVPGCKSIVFLTNGVKKPGTPLDPALRPYNGLTIDVIWVLLLFLLRFHTLILRGTYTGLELILNLLHSWHASNRPPPTQLINSLAGLDSIRDEVVPGRDLVRELTEFVWEYPEMESWLDIKFTRVTTPTRRLCPERGRDHQDYWFILS